MIWFERIFYALVALAALQIVYYYPKMPEVVASHFDGLGAPNAWSGRNGFFGLYAAILAILVLIFIWAPKWSESRLKFGMKLPNPEYWLGPERIEQTKKFFRRQMLIMGVLHLGLAIYVMQLAIEANFMQEPRIHDSVYWALGFYFLVLIAWLIHFFLHFRRL